jgi:Co/Zn/Cd efflux system component|tara:strand:- start:1681 stop:1896 length:216 start_codon:yes stop_codon:yes gene_type:complete
LPNSNASSSRFSFGTGKVNALGGFTGAVLLAGFALFMVVESIDRFIHPVTISFNGAIFVAIIGLIVNGVSA